MYSELAEPYRGSKHTWPVFLLVSLIVNFLKMDIYTKKLAKIAPFPGELKTLPVTVIPGYSSRQQVEQA